MGFPWSLIYCKVRILLQRDCFTVRVKWFYFELKVNLLFKQINTKLVLKLQTACRNVGSDYGQKRDQRSLLWNSLKPCQRKGMLFCWIDKYLVSNAVRCFNKACKISEQNNKNHLKSHCSADLNLGVFFNWKPRQHMCKRKLKLTKCFDESKNAHKSSQPTRNFSSCS